MAASVRVRRATTADAPAIAQVIGHPQVAPQTLQLPWVDAERWTARLAETLAPGKQDLVLVAELQGIDGVWSVVGNAGLHPSSAALRRRHAMGLGIVVLPSVQGQGVGSTLMRALCDYADRWGQVLRIELTVFADNQRAIALYERFGFEHEGRLRGYALRDGDYVDVLTMARLHPNAPRIGAWGGG